MWPYALKCSNFMAPCQTAGVAGHSISCPRHPAWLSRACTLTGIDALLPSCAGNQAHSVSEPLDGRQEVIRNNFRRRTGRKKFTLTQAVSCQDQKPGDPRIVGQ